MKQKNVQENALRNQAAKTRLNKNGSKNIQNAEQDENII